MKRITITLCLLISVLLSNAQSFDDLSFGTDTTFEVVTWNIEWFPKNGQTTINYVKEIIEALDVDVLAIQEVDEIVDFNALIAELAEYEGYLESSYFAGLAYIYKKATIEINDIFEIYTTSAYWSAFPRSPMVMDLTYMNQRIFLINNHFKCCGDGTLELPNSDDEETRRYIASNLLKDYVDDDLPGENVIVLGDLNDILTDAAENNVFQQLLDDSDNFLFADYDIAAGNEDHWSYPSWPSHLDHVLITNELFDEFAKAGSDIQTIKLEEYMSGGWSAYDEDISDHRPVALKLAMKLNVGSDGTVSEAPYFINYPNPFASQTRFSFDIAEGKRDIEIINLLGQTVFSARIPEGMTTFTWHADNLPEGIYLAKLHLDNREYACVKLLLKK